MAQQAQKKGAGGAKGPGGGNKTFLLLGGLIVAAGIGWLLTAGGGAAAGPLPTPAEFEALAADITADPSTGVPLGSADAPILIEEFIDFSCPACAQFSGFAGKLLRQNYVEIGNVEAGEGGPVRWVSYDYVLGSFPNSVPAAMAARCAEEQGRFWPMHDFIF
ncbi:MAG: DsbA family protein, partial [Gemmatimonadetes bacterium]|nr:DsbA family protein [Gemmatimonadota bacterium]